jgi:ABC-type lipoprotein release transport system permease subunit
VNLRTLLVQSLLHHWRANLAVLLGVIVGAATLTGALVVGDSLRGSLADLTLDRLGDTRYALVSERFFRGELANELSAALKDRRDVQAIAPAILLRGSVVRRGPDGSLLRRAGRVQIAAVDDRFWELFNRNPPANWADGVVVNQALADELNIAAGGSLETQFERPQALPSDSIVGRPVDDSGQGLEGGLRLTERVVTAVLPMQGPGRFSLNAQQQQPLILYVPLDTMQIALRDSLSLRNAANAILVSCPPADEASAKERLSALTTILNGLARPEDVGLTLRPDLTGTRYLAVESRRMLLEPGVVRAVDELAREKGWETRPTLTYLVNLLLDETLLRLDLASAVAAHAGGDMMSALLVGRAASAYTPYLTVTVLDPTERAPWGPFWNTAGDLVNQPPLDNTIYLTEDAARDLWHFERSPHPRLHYFVESEGWLLKERAENLALAGVIALRDAAADPVLTPDFPGIKGKKVPSDWKPPFPRSQWHPSWFRRSDELYWERHQATPRGYVSLGTARSLGWVSRHGDWTSIRVALPEPAKRVDAFWADLKGKLPPEKLGLQFRDVRAEGLAATRSGTSEMFGWLFLGFSFFLILSGAMLVGLLFRLGVERRSREIGLLVALGYTQRTVRRLLLTEGIVIAVLGALLGLVLAVGYAAILLQWLNRAWAGALQTTFLRLHVASADPAFGPLPYPSLVLGFALSVGIAIVAILLGLRGLRHASPRALLSGQASSENEPMTPEPGGWGRWVALGCLVAAVALAIVSFFVPQPAAAPLFFGSGATLLAAGIVAATRWLRSARGYAIAGQGAAALARFGLRNTSRNPMRSSLTLGLLASATFLIVAVESFRKGDDGNHASGTGGFVFLAEADVPLRPPPDNLGNWRALVPGRPREQEAGWNALRNAGYWIYSFYLRPGDDVSCLNLYEPQQPRVLGVPRDTLRAERFHLLGIDQPSHAEQANPWLVLERQLRGEVPVVADNHTAQWVLKKGVGDAWQITDDRGEPVTLRLVALVQDSIFQSELLMSETNFRRLFPGRDRFGFFLIDCQREKAAAVRQTLEAALGERYGFNIQSASARLAEYHAVENTYLSTFQALGGLGLLLGSLGLAVVLLRNVWERRGELALLRAMGYRHGTLGWLLFFENATLVIVGLALGLAAALAAVTPHLLDAARVSTLPWLGIGGLLSLVVGVGLLAGAVAAIRSLRAPLLSSLRRE